MKWFWWSVLVVALLAPAALARQDNPSADQLKRMYDDALVQLRAAQDRKNELAVENERLAARVAELEKELSAVRSAADRFHERTLFLRSHHAAWQRFVRQSPEIEVRWKQFVETDPLAGERIRLFDPRWPVASGEE
jgi:predicted nuclease with TOPRIM domain